ncbi:hypothetical protein SEA_KRADAL_264 [Streptomyces phage Kradal]|nr:hypothetical protein SEA_KRADAL_264 [Streptomyces phage Kradal]QPL14572.1 hypothetical protein SEA_EHYELIMAYOE_267 [Streptomyces phage EhyElimayoE]
MSMTREEETALAEELAEELGLNLPFAAQCGFKYDVKAARAKAAELREIAKGNDREAADSFDRCDTDGFLSQWASGITAEKYRLRADVAENGGMWSFPALFDLEGNLVPAREVHGQYGVFWSLLDAEGNRTGKTFNESRAQNDKVRVRNDAKKGYYVGAVLAPAYVVTRGQSATSVACHIERSDGGWDPDVMVIDNGKN